MISEFQRDVLAAKAEYLIAHSHLMDYAEVRPMQTASISWVHLEKLFDSGLSITTDCSESVTDLFRWSGLRDPNGLGYNGLGYTGTMLAHLPHYHDPHLAHKGALVIFNDPAHVCMVIEENGANPWLFSHGQPGCLRISLSEEAKYHASIAAFLSVEDL